MKNEEKRVIISKIWIETKAGAQSFFIYIINHLLIKSQLGLFLLPGLFAFNWTLFRILIENIDPI